MNKFIKKISCKNPHQTKVINWFYYLEKFIKCQNKRLTSNKKERQNPNQNIVAP